MRENYVLSICIPTYNRGPILEKVLEAITKDPSFDTRIEVVISDNCSNDNTREVCKAYTSVYENIRYYKTDEQINEENFVKVLSHANGLYIKLHNDYAVFKSGMLEKMIEAVEVASIKCESLLFIQNNHEHDDVVIRSENVDAFIQNTSYAICWISNVGLWKRDFLYIRDDCFRYTKLNYVHVDVCLRALFIRPSAIVHYADYYDIDLAPINKASYNVFEVNVANLLLVFAGFDGCRGLTNKTINKLKRSIFKNVAFGHLLTLLKSTVTKVNSVSKYDDWGKVLWTNYGYRFPVYFISDACGYVFKRVFSPIFGRRSS